MTSTAIYKCKCCGGDFIARTADRKRGWAKFCSKSCKAIRQTQRTGRGQGGKLFLPNGGWIIGNTEYDKHGCFVGVQLSQADMAEHGQW